LTEDVPTDDKKRAAYRALEDRILHGDGKAASEQRGRAFGNAGLAPPLAGLVGKVAASPHVGIRSAGRRTGGGPIAHLAWIERVDRAIGILAARLCLTM
jgi:hypothetical protein